MSQEDRERIDRTIKGTDMRSDSRILDIDAGPDTLAIPSPKENMTRETCETNKDTKF
ncbi:MAG: hypothetical protein LUQ22_01070 [Methanotrichaceae archaeon]|nr:hypothetical protein [Methanotrichaceae archaeon]